MLLGKRPRPPIKRTTSMTGITVDLTTAEAHEPSDLTNQESGPLPQTHNNNNYMNFGSKGYQESFLATMLTSPRNAHRSNSADFIETAHFLRTCGLCKRRLASGRDIYMYMGDTAFCSLECREQQMKQDERKEKKCMAVAVAASKNDVDRRETTSSKSSKASSSGGKSQTVAAA